MRIRIQRRGLVPAVVLTVVGVLVLYLASTVGWAALQSTRTSSSGVGTLPDVLERAPDSVGTTEDHGPIGSVSLVYAGTHVRDGLLGELDPVWLAVSSQTGDTRALDAPGLPEPGPGAVSVSPAGDRLAWVDGSDVVVYDTITGASESMPTSGVTAVGAFSPDGSELLVHAGGLVALDAESGERLSEFDADESALRRAAWRSDGAAVDFVQGEELVTGSVPGSDLARRPTDIPEGSQLAWSDSGEQLASLQRDGGTKRIHVSTLDADGRLGPAQQIRAAQTSVERLLGFSGDARVGVLALRLDSGAVERLLDIPFDGRTPVDLTTLPAAGENWTGSASLAIATDTLEFDSSEFPEHVWPWSYAARLAACSLIGFFLLGLFVTRRRR